LLTLRQPARTSTRDSFSQASFDPAESGVSLQKRLNASTTTLAIRS
jgi:hypothetical protein